MANLDSGHWASTVRTLGIDSDQVSDMALNVQIRFALRDFNRLLPKMVTATISTVANTQDYTLPAACLYVWRVYYVPGSVTDVSSSLVDVGAYDYFYLPSQAIIWDLQYFSHVRGQMGSWELVNPVQATKTLRLIPIPTSVDTVTYIYMANRTAAEIPEEMEPVMMDAVLSRVYEQMAMLPDSMVETFTDSGMTIRVGDMSKKYARASKMYESQFITGAKAFDFFDPSTRSDATWV